MARNVDRDIVIPPELTDGLQRYLDRQEAERGANPDVRVALEKDPGAVPPYPSPSNEMLAYLLYAAQARLTAGVLAREVLLNLAPTAWMEGHIEGFDQGYRAGLAARS